MIIDVKIWVVIEETKIIDATDSQKVLNSHQKMGSEYVRLDADKVTLVFSPRGLCELVG